jgi:EamA domain-containing membrane protein RarD
LGVLEEKSMDEGLLYAFGAYLIWGLFPLYWKLLKSVPATQLIGHRIIWSFVLLAGVLRAPPPDPLHHTAKAIGPRQ